MKKMNENSFDEIINESIKSVLMEYYCGYGDNYAKEIGKISERLKEITLDMLKVGEKKFNSKHLRNEITIKTLMEVTNKLHSISRQMQGFDDNVNSNEYDMFNKNYGKNVINVSKA